MCESRCCLAEQRGTRPYDHTAWLAHSAILSSSTQADCEPFCEGFYQ
uniref:Uncharacterized protein n=1 Tax=Parascaris equorum TaxID=6256 RepID=A0A914R2J4_PAREQ